MSTQLGTRCPLGSPWPDSQERNMSETQDAGQVALQILETVRAANPALIADSMPAGWGMNRLRSCLQPQLNLAEGLADEPSTRSRVTKTVLQFTVLHDDDVDLSSHPLEDIAHICDGGGYIRGKLTAVSSQVLSKDELDATAAALGADPAFFDVEGEEDETDSTPAAKDGEAEQAFEWPFFVVIDHEQSVSDHPTLHEARLAGQAACDAEVLPCSFSIHDARGNHVEDIVRSDGASIGDQVKTFNASHGPR